jgi:glycyl-tRNA synthetase beta chain
MSTEASTDLLLEIGCEELPASFVDAALRALPDLANKRLAELRLAHGEVRVYGTPRRLALVVEGLAMRQPNLEAEVLGPPAKAAFKDGVPTKAAEAFAQKVGCAVAELRTVPTPKGEYLAGTRREEGQPTAALLPAMLSGVITSIPFRKSMRWADLDIQFGRPIQWLVALFGDAVVPLEFGGIRAGNASRGHRFLVTGPVPIPSARAYSATLRAAHVLVDPGERESAMLKRLVEAASSLGGTLIEDAFLVEENRSLVEEPHVVAGGYEAEFLELPERVILEVAKGHQRYFGVRAKDGKLLPRYLSVVNTAVAPETIRRGNDRVMRARLADARFFYREDLKLPLAERRGKLAGIVFQKRLGSVLAKAERVERLAREIGLSVGLPEPIIMAAASGAHLAKCDLVTLMVGEFPELQGEMGRAYALVQGVSADVADVIRDHYMPKGASDDTAPTDAAALVSIADRIDTLVGCFGVGLTPTGAADPYALRRACLGVLRTLLDRGYDLAVDRLVALAVTGYAGVTLDRSEEELTQKLGDFFTDRLRGLLEAKLPADAVSASLAVAANRPLDARARATAIASLSEDDRARVGEVFKRATNIASSAPSGQPSAPGPGSHASEGALFEGYQSLRATLQSLAKAGDYSAAFRAIGEFAPRLAQYFADVFVMSEDEAVRNERLRLMRAISESCSTLARLELLGG